MVRTKKGNGGMKDRVDRSNKTRGMTTLIENSPVETEVVLVVLNILNSRRYKENQRQQQKNTYKFIVKVTRDSRNIRNERNRI